MPDFPYRARQGNEVVQSQGATRVRYRRLVNSKIR